MKSSAQVVVIGGGVVGASVLYHLTEAGWTDVVLVERKELTAGSTWHSAGGMHTLNGDPNVSKLQQYTIELYRTIEARSGQNCSIHLPGGLMLADDRERLDWLRMAQARGRYLGMELEIISAAEAKALFPLLEEQYFVGALFDPVEGHVDPSGVTNAYAICARQAGRRGLPAHVGHDLRQRADGTWDVDHRQRRDPRRAHRQRRRAVGARGRADDRPRAAGARHGAHVPRHRGHGRGRRAQRRRPATSCRWRSTSRARSTSARSRAGCCSARTSRRACRGRRTGAVELRPWSCCRPTSTASPRRWRSPSSTTRRWRRPASSASINGPFTFAPDGNPLVGPIRGIRNCWVACAVMAGLSQGGGVGLALANWMTTGDPQLDVWGMDVARFGDWANLAYTNAKVRENYSRRFRITFPNEELPAARPLHTTPVYDRLTEHNAVWGAGFGLEHPLWFQRPGEEPVEDVTFRRSNAFAVVAEECRAVRERVGLTECSNFAKYRVTGPGAAEWLQGLFTNRLPKIGRIALTAMLNPSGRIVGEFSVARIGDDEFFLFGSQAAEVHHSRWFLAHLPADGAIRFEVLALSLVGLSRRRAARPATCCSR